MHSSLEFAGPWYHLEAASCPPSASAGIQPPQHVTWGTAGMWPLANSLTNIHTRHKTSDIWQYIYGLVHDCSNSSALAMELLQSCTKPSISYTSAIIFKHDFYILSHNIGWLVIIC